MKNGADDGGYIALHFGSAGALTHLMTTLRRHKKRAVRSDDAIGKRPRENQLF
jgi:hypothetical protein